MPRQPWNRLLAWLVDWLCILGWVAITAAVGVPLYLAGVTGDLGIVALNVIGLLVVIVPVTLGVAGLESGRRRATIGKRVRRLRVIGAGGKRVGFARALLRNALKIALPWTIGHAVAFGFTESGTTGSIPAWLWITTGVAYALPISYLVTLFVGTGRTPYDRLAATTVVRP